MKTASVGEIQKNFAKVLNDIRNGDEIIITKRGKPIARIVSLPPKSEIEWPDFYSEAINLKGKPISEIVIEGREDRF
ncbi:MAG: type II toxin-antitoxin system prevent-host-death family antitoxin [Thermodesulfobacteriota bacterium]|nr:type II toxin-antitoxin system prevent-host-death family antitoxin [Thermodesulfobacteriota bacterium]